MTKLYTQYRSSVWAHQPIYFEWRCEYKLLNGIVQKAPPNTANYSCRWPNPPGYIFLLQRARVLLHSQFLQLSRLFLPRILWSHHSHTAVDSLAPLCCGSLCCPALFSSSLPFFFLLSPRVCSHLQAPKEAFHWLLSIPTRECFTQNKASRVPFKHHLVEENSKLYRLPIKWKWSDWLPGIHSITQQYQK